MPKFVIGSVYLLKNKPKMYYVGDMAGVLHFKDLSTGAIYQALATEVEFEAPKVKASSDIATTTTTATSTSTAVAKVK